MSSVKVPPPCIGTQLARMSGNLMSNAIADHNPDLKPLDTPDRLKSGWLNGSKTWRVDYTGKSA